MERRVIVVEGMSSGACVVTDAEVFVGDLSDAVAAEEVAKCLEVARQRPAVDTVQKAD